MKQIKLNIKTKTDKYQIVIGSNLTNKFSRILKISSIKSKKYFIIVDQNVPRKFVSNIKKSLTNKIINFYFFDSNERNKNLKNVNKILEILTVKNYTREDCLVSVGGGITGDVGGFVASLFKRGMKFINVPTTLLSQVDSSIGGKTGVNTKHGKNLIGSFYQPCLVISDTEFLKSLPKREVICGYGEILKHSVIKNKKFFYSLNKNVKNILNLSSPFIERAIYESCKIKKNVIEKDEKEMGLRKILNFGHTFAHAYEASIGYNKKLNHGEAVILGMKTALNFSLKEKFLNKKDYDLIIDHMESSGLPISLNKYFKKKDLNKILYFMVKDKKNSSAKISLVLLKKIGFPIFNKEYSKKNIKSFLKSFL